MSSTLHKYWDGYPRADHLVEQFWSGGGGKLTIGEDMVEKMRRWVKRLTCLFVSVLCLTPKIDVQAASATIEYTSGMGLKAIVEQLNEKLNLNSDAGDWTFYTTGAAELECTAFWMDRTDDSGNVTTYNMMNYMHLGSKDSDAYRVYQNYMEEFQKEESSGYFPINKSSYTIKSKQVDKGDVYYSLQTPVAFEGTSHTVIRYYGHVTYTSFLDQVAPGATFDMQYKGVNHKVSFVEKSITESTPAVPEDDSSQETQGGTQGGSQDTSDEGVKAPEKVEIKVHDSVSNTTQENTVVPGRTQYSSDLVLWSTIEQSLQPETKDEAEEFEQEREEVYMEDVGVGNAVTPDQTPVYYIYEVDTVTEEQEDAVGTICTVSLTGIAGIGLIRLLYIFLKLKRGI